MNDLLDNGRLNMWINVWKRRFMWRWRPIYGWFKSKYMIKMEKKIVQDFPIDFVITWVDGNDTEWQREKERYFEEFNYHTSGNGTERYRDWGLLLHWFRSVEKYAPWVHKVYIVTNGQCPNWLNINNSKLCFVSHKDFIPAKYLPTFCSDVIELNLWRIAGLSEHFVYFNDDVFLNNPVEPEDFFQYGLPKCFAVAIPLYVGSIGDFWLQRTLNDYAIINKSFDLRRCIEQYPEKFYSCIYTKDEKRLNNRIYIDNYVSGVPITHTVQNFLKSSFVEIWNRYEDALDSTCLTKFRCIDDLTSFVITLWQIYSGKFYPALAQHFQMHISLSKLEISRAISAIQSDEYKFLCLNDNENLELEDEDTILEMKRCLVKAFDKKFPAKSEFEL